MDDILSLVLWLIVVFGPALISIFKKKDKKKQRGTKTAQSSTASPNSAKPAKQQEQASAQDIEAWLQALSEPKPHSPKPAAPKPAQAKAKPVVHDVEVIDTPPLNSDRPAPKLRGNREIIERPKREKAAPRPSTRQADAQTKRQTLRNQRKAQRSTLSANGARSKTKTQSPDGTTPTTSNASPPRVKRSSFARQHLLGRSQTKRAVTLHEIFSPPIALRDQPSQ